MTINEIERSDWPRPFSPHISRTRFFQDMGFALGDETLRYMPFPAKTDDSIVRGKSKKPYFGPIFAANPKLGSNRIFVENSGSVTFFSHITVDESCLFIKD